LIGVKVKVENPNHEMISLKALR